MSNLSLYKIEQSLEELVQLRDAAEDEGDSVALASIDEAIKEYLTREVVKVDSYVGIIRRLEDDAARCEKEAARLTTRAQRFRADVERLKRNALAAMQRFGVKELRTPTVGMRRQGNSGVQPLDVYEQSELSRDLMTATVSMPLSTWDLIRPSMALWKLVDLTPDKNRIREALKRGEKVDGAKLLDRGEHVRIV